MVLNRLDLSASHICTSPRPVPMARCVPFCIQDTLVTVSSSSVHSFVTRLVCAFHMYTLEPRPTPSTLALPQSTRFR